MSGRGGAGGGDDDDDDDDDDDVEKGELATYSALSFYAMPYRVI